MILEPAINQLTYWNAGLCNAVPLPRCWQRELHLGPLVLNIGIFPAWPKRRANVSLCYGRHIKLSAWPRHHTEVVTVQAGWRMTCPLCRNFQAFKISFAMKTKFILKFPETETGWICPGMWKTQFPSSSSAYFKTEISIPNLSEEAPASNPSGPAARLYLACDTNAFFPYTSHKYLPNESYVETISPQWNSIIPQNEIAYCLCWQLESTLTIYLICP